MDNKIREERKINCDINYRKLYQDIILAKYPDKMEQCNKILSKEDFSTLDVMKISTILFPHRDKKSRVFDQRHRSYDCETIQHILSYQKKNSLSNMQIALTFRISRNTIAKWKKIFNQKIDSKPTRL